MRVTMIDVLRGSARNAHKLPMQLRALPTVLGGSSASTKSIGALIERNARRYGTRPALITADRTVTWRELNRFANRLAHALSRRGIGRRDVVGLLEGSSIELLACVVAVAKLGATSALMNTAQRGGVLEHSVAVSGAKAVVAGAEYVGLVDGAWPLTELLEEAEGAPEWDPWSTGTVTLGDAAFTIFTSGTTGLPKASVMTHMRWIKASAVYSRVFLQLSPDDVVYVPLPFFHNMALTAAWSAACRAGAAMAIAPRFSASRFWEDCRTFGATAFPYIGEIPRYLLAQPPSDRDQDHGVRRVFGVGMRPELWGPFCERFGIPTVLEHYAASEANTMFLNPLNIPGSIGFCVSTYKLVRYDVDNDEVVRGRDGKPVLAARGEAGLLLCEVSERFQFDGYTDPEASEKKLRRDVFAPGDVWFDSGDLLRKVGWGHAQFVDRVGDTFRWKSENVSTAQVETILGAHPSVAEAAVYGVEVRGAPGRAGMAAVVADGALDLDELLTYLRRELPPYAVPVFLRLKPSLETTGTHKHRKGDLRKQGYDPAVVHDPLYVARPEGWVKLDRGVLTEIESGAMRL